jgi:DNA-binding response OmpR family regulator
MSSVVAFGLFRNKTSEIRSSPTFSKSMESIAISDSSVKNDRKPRIVAVDDQRDALRLLQLRLQNAGMVCSPFSDGTAALEFLGREPADLIILDIMMPTMDGYELCRRIKENPKTRDIPVLFLSAKFESEDKVKGLEVGAHDYLTKPVDQGELVARTRAALRVKYLQDQLREKIDLQAKVGQLHQGMLSEHWQKTLGQLAASLAHEINNPLAAALGSVQLLAMDDTASTSVLHGLQIVDKSLQRAGQKLRSLLLIAHNGRQIQSVSLKQFVSDLLTIVNFQLVMNKVTLQTSLPESCIVHAVPGELARAILYVLNNAVEAVSGLEDAQVGVSLESGKENHRLLIKDNGPGIASEIRDRIFEAFFTTKTQPHNGVGLYLAKEIIDSLGGRILIPCTGPTGTEFVLELPARSEY